MLNYGPSRHYTFIFNLFVLLQLANFFNSRKLKDELNVFGGIMKSINFNIIVLSIMILQSVIVTHGGLVFSCYKYKKDGYTGGGLVI